MNGGNEFDKFMRSFSIDNQAALFGRSGSMHHWLSIGILVHVEPSNISGFTVGILYTLVCRISSMYVVAE